MQTITAGHPTPQKRSMQYIIDRIIRIYISMQYYRLSQPLSHVPGGTVACIARLNITTQVVYSRYEGSLDVLMNTRHYLQFSVRKCCNSNLVEPRLLWLKQLFYLIVSTLYTAVSL